MNFNSHQKYFKYYPPILSHFSELIKLYSKRINLNFLALLLIVFFTFPITSNAQKDSFIVVLDAGHGGDDPGALGSKSKEKDITLAITLKVGNYIKENLKNVKVIYTRTDDTYPTLYQRSRLANRSHADLFISIHVNSAGNKNVTGTSTFVMGLHKNAANLKVAQTENAYVVKEKDYKSNYSGFDPNSPESYIRMSLEQNTYLDLSLSFAAKIQDQFEHRAGRKSRGVKQAGFLVLWNTTMPSVLIETGFLTNKTEEKYLLSEYGQDIIASAIYRAFRDYKNEIEKHSINNIPVATDSVKSLDENLPVFKIQIAASKNKINLNSRKYKKYPDIKEKLEGKYYKYTIGNENNYEEIIKLHKKVKKHFKDSYIVAYKNNKKISVRDARNEIIK